MALTGRSDDVHRFPKRRCWKTVKKPLWVTNWKNTNGKWFLHEMVVLCHWSKGGLDGRPRLGSEEACMQWPPVSN